MRTLGGALAEPRVRTAAALFALVAAAAPVLLAAPAPADRLACRPGQDQAILEQQGAVRAAGPGDDLYLPFPYPATDAQAIEDFTQQIEYWEAKIGRDLRAQSSFTYLIWKARYLTWDAGLTLSDLLPANALRMVGIDSYSIRQHHLRFVVERVQDWSHVRCVARPAHTWRVVRAFDIRSGIEVSRGALTDAGYYGQGVTASPDSPLAPWPDAAAVAAELGRRLDVKLRDATLVRASGPCTGAAVPCVAAESADGSAIFFTQGTKVFRVSLLDRLLTPAVDFASAEAFRATIERLGHGQLLFSLGPETFAVGETLTTQLPRERDSAE